MGDLQLFLGHLEQPEYVHVLLNPMPVYGMAAGAFVLAVCLVLRKDPVPALMWLVLVGAATWLAVRSGQQGYDRVLAMSNGEAQAWLQVHMARAETAMYVFYATGAAALVALLTRRRWPQAFWPLVVAALLLAVVSMNLGGWISQAGGQVRHAEFREGAPPAGLLPLEEEPHHSHGGEGDR